MLLILITGGMKAREIISVRNMRNLDAINRAHFVAWEENNSKRTYSQLPIQHKMKKVTTCKLLNHMATSQKQAVTKHLAYHSSCLMKRGEFYKGICGLVELRCILLLYFST